MQLSTCLDSAYWIGICWNLYQLSNDSVFLLEAEKYLPSLSPILEDTNFNADKAFRAYLAFGKGFDATGNHRYRGKVWDIADYMLTDTTCITPFTVEVLLWGTTHKGCHCFREAAIRWGKRQIDSDSLSLDILQGISVLYMYTSDTIYRNAMGRMRQIYVLNSKMDSLRLASVYCHINLLTSESMFHHKAVNLLQNYFFDKDTALSEVFFLTEVLLNFRC